MGLECPAPQGAFYLFPNFDCLKNLHGFSDINTSHELTAKIMQQAQVALLPGANFYRPINELSLRLSPVDYNGKKVLKHVEQHNNLNSSDIEALCPKVVNGLNKIAQFIKENAAISAPTL